MQRATVLAVDDAAEAMEGSMGRVAHGVDSLADFVDTTTTLVGETASAFEEVRRKGLDLERAVETTLADVARLAGAGREAEQQLRELETLASDAGSSLGSVRTSASAMEQTASEGEANAESVASMAERAGGVVLETVHGIETLRAAVGDAHRRIARSGGAPTTSTRWSTSSPRWPAGRTCSRSTPPSSRRRPASTARPSRSWRTRSASWRRRSPRSTKSIGDIIHSLREEVEATSALIDRGDALAGEGVQLARNSYEALAQIQRSTATGRDAAAGMRRAAESHGNATREVARLVQSIADGSRAVTTAVQLVGRSVGGVDAVSRNVGALADQLARALEGQVGGAGGSWTTSRGWRG